MNIVYKNVIDLKPYGRNNKIHSERQIKIVSESIKEFGFKNPVIVDDKNSIIAGHCRVKGAQLLNMEQVPCIVADDLTKQQIKAYRIADNKLTELGEWDNEMLALELKDLLEADFDIEMLGFEKDELNDLLTELNFEAGTEEDQSKLDQLEPKWIICPHCGKEFDEREN